jgi:hypothetical protein
VKTTAQTEVQESTIAKLGRTWVVFFDATLAKIATEYMYTTSGSK